MSDRMLTTCDNPFNPFTHFEEWFKYDMTNGYNTCGYLANMAMTSKNFGKERNEEEIQRAMDEIVETEPMIYRTVQREATSNAKLN